MPIDYILTFFGFTIITALNCLKQKKTRKSHNESNIF